MNARLQRLRAEVRSDLEAFARRVDELARLSFAGAGEAVLAQAAVALHHGYGAIEAALTRVARHFEGAPPTGPDWHQDLLHVMGLEIPGVRPPLLAADTVRGLRNLLGFRHFFRHAYATAWDAQRLLGLRDEVLALRPAVERDFTALDSLLAQLAAAESD